MLFLVDGLGVFSLGKCKDDFDAVCGAETGVDVAVLLTGSLAFGAGVTGVVEVTDEETVFVGVATTADSLFAEVIVAGIPAETGVVKTGVADFFSTTGAVSAFTGVACVFATLVAAGVGAGVIGAAADFVSTGETGETGSVDVDGAGIGMADSFSSASSSPVKSVILMESMENLLFVCIAAAIGGSGLLGPVAGSGVVV